MLTRKLQGLGLRPQVGQAESWFVDMVHTSDPRMEGKHIEGTSVNSQHLESSSGRGKS